MAELDYGAVERAIDGAVGAFNQQHAALFDEKGGMRYWEDQHRERVRELTAALHQEAAGIVGVVDDELAEVERLERARQADPLLSLGSTDRATASSIAPFVREDCETLPLGDLLTAVRAEIAQHTSLHAAHSGVWARYLSRRLGKEQARLAEGEQHASAEERRALEGLAGELRRLRAGLAENGPGRDLPSAEDLERRRTEATRARARVLGKVEAAASGGASDRRIADKLRATI
jgi:hypothetical protein